MNESDWVYLRNTFRSVTEGSFKRMNLLATDHMDKLRERATTDPAVADIMAVLQPSYDKFKELYRNRITVAASYRAATRRVEDLMADLSGNQIARWDVRIQVEFPERSATYLEMLPDGRAPFQRGAYEARIREVESLADRLAPFPVLLDVRNEINLFITNLRALRSRQQQIEGREATAANDLEAARQDLAHELHRAFGALIARYVPDLIKVESLYELKYLRRSASDSDPEEDPDGEGAAA